MPECQSILIQLKHLIKQNKTQPCHLQTWRTASLKFANYLGEKDEYFNINMSHLNETIS